MRIPVHEGMLSITYTWAIGLGIVVGTTARVITLMVDYRQAPTYPDGQFIHLFAGLIATTLGAAVIPALLGEDYMTFTFLALVVQHSRNIHKMERESLNDLKLSGYARRGNTYIDGVSKTYEARDYTSMISSMIISSAVLLMENLSCALVVIVAAALGMLPVFLLKWLTRGKRVGGVCVIQQGKIQVQGSNLFVGDIYVTGVAGPPVTWELFLQQRLDVMITPKEEQFRVTLENVGQRQAILYEAASTLGVKTYQHVKRSMEQSKMMIALVLVDRDIGRMIAVIQNTPVLGNSHKVRRIMPRQESGKE